MSREPNTSMVRRASRLRGRGLAGLGAASLAAGLAGCSADEPPPAPPPPVVDVATPQTRAVTDYFYYTGVFESVERAEIRARVPGYLTSVEFADSTDVEAGELLFTIERDTYEIAVGRAEAAVSEAQANLDVAETVLRRTEAAMERNAANELELIENRAAKLRAEAAVKSADQQLRQARLDLSYTEVRSPIAGRIDRNYVDVGNLVGQGEPTLLATVIQNDPIHVTFEVSERIVLQYISRGADGTVDREAPPLEAGLSDEVGYPHPGIVDFVDSEVDGGTGTLTVRGVLDNPTTKIFPGLFARIRVPWEVREDAVLVREEAVGTGLDGKFVLIVGDGSVVERRQVTLGERQEDGTIVVLEGIGSDETYIVNGLQRARPGAPVTPRPLGAPPVPAGASPEGASAGAGETESGADEDAPGDAG